MTHFRGIATQIIVLFLAAAAAPAVLAQVNAAPAPVVPKAVMSGSHLAVECTFLDEGENKIWSIEQADLDGKPAFKIPVRSSYNGKDATVIVAADRIALESQKPQDSFDDSRTDVMVKILRRKETPLVLELQGAQRKQKYGFLAQAGNKHFMTVCCLLDAFPACTNLIETALTDFSAAEKRFAQITRNLPPMREAEWRDFQPRAAAWRALPARPPLSEAVRKQLLLAEDAVNQKQFEAAAAAYDAGTEIDPMWPEGHFNAAAIYGELKDYDDAVWHMRCYLELIPNAPDAQNARDQMLLWQAKAEQQAAAQTEPAKTEPAKAR
jgi:tetratricopeptide (TPR) repeat protein